jgi:hypothetical protein
VTKPVLHLSRRTLLGSAAAMNVPAFGAAAQGEPQRRKATLSDVLSFRPHNDLIPGFDAPSGMTFSTLYTLDAPPAWVRLVYQARKTPYVIDGAAIATTAAVHDGVSPVNRSGTPDDTLWRRVTFNHNGDESTPAPPGTQSIYRLSVPSRQGLVMGFSDWVRVDPLPRSDGGHGVFVLVRTYAGKVLPTTWIPWGEPLNHDIDCAFGSFQSEGDGTAPPWRFTGTHTNWTGSIGLQYVTGTPGATVMGIGDSIMMPPYSVPFGLRASLLVSTPQRPVSYVNASYIGFHSEEYLSRAASNIAALKPQIVLIQTFTGNDPITDKSPDAAFKGALRLTDTAMKSGCVPIFVGPPPEPEITPAEEAVRQDGLRRTRALAAQGFAVLDIDALWTDSASPTHWRKGYNTDRWHPSDVATAAAGKALAPILLRALDRA